MNESTENESTATGGSPVEPEGELLQVGLEMTRNNRSLMCAENPPLEEAGNPMYSRHRNMSGVTRRFQHHSLVHVAVVGGGAKGT